MTDTAGYPTHLRGDTRGLACLEQLQVHKSYSLSLLNPSPGRYRHQPGCADVNTDAKAG